ncbi:MAG: NnrS family protein [Fibrobacteria bacterium]
MQNTRINPLPVSSLLAWGDVRKEPYRLLFPLGYLLAAIGIGIWIPFCLWPQRFPYPGQGHAVMQIQGFLLCFILGFLMTMLPKVLGVNQLGRAQSILFPIGILAISVCVWNNAPQFQSAVHGLHLFVLGNFLVFILRRWPHRTNSPPPTFVFIPLAFAADAVGTLLRLLMAVNAMDADALRLATLLQFQAFPVLLILGIGGFLLPKLFANGVVDPATLIKQKGGPLLIPLGLGSILLGSYALEAASPAFGSGTMPLRLAYLIRSAVWAWFTLGQLRLMGITGKVPAYLAAVRLALLLMGLGMFLPVFFPAYLIAWEHLVFITGFLWLTLSVAARVVASHGGSMGTLVQHRKKVLAYGALIVLAMISRISADFWADGHWLYLALASGFALVALVFWGRIFLPLIFASNRK